MRLFLVLERNGEQKTVTAPYAVTDARAGRRGRGMLSGIVNLTGELLALPFRLIGGFLQWVF